MKINKKSTTYFKNVPAGAVFRDIEGTIYMKLDVCYKNASVVLYNAVILENGSLTYIEDRENDIEVLENAVLTY